MANYLRIRNLSRQPLRIGTKFIPVPKPSGTGGTVLVDMDDGASRRDLNRFFPRWAAVDSASAGSQFLNGNPGGVFRESIDRRLAGTNSSALTTQVMTSVAVPVREGDVISNVTFVSATTAAGTPTNWWFAIYDSSATPALIQQSADQLTAAWAANTAKTLALAASYTVPSDGYLWASIMVKATTPPTLMSYPTWGAAQTYTSSALVNALSPIAVTSGSSLTTTAPATIASPSAIAILPYAVLS